MENVHMEREGIVGSVFGVICHSEKVPISFLQRDDGRGLTLHAQCTPYKTST